MACDIAIYTPTIIRRKEEVLNAPSSTIHLYFESNLVSVMDEKAGYDFNQFVADVGGSLGFLLGMYSYIYFSQNCYRTEPEHCFSRHLTC